MTLNVHMVNIKFIVADLIYMFIVDRFFILSCLESQLFVLNSYILIFIFPYFQTISYGDTSKLELECLTRLKACYLKYFLFEFI